MRHFTQRRCVEVRDTELRKQAYYIELPDGKFLIVENDRTARIEQNDKVRKVFDDTFEDV